MNLYVCRIIHLKFVLSFSDDYKIAFCVVNVGTSQLAHSLVRRAVNRAVVSSSPAVLGFCFFV